MWALWNLKLFVSVCTFNNAICYYCLYSRGDLRMTEHYWNDGLLGREKRNVSWQTINPTRTGLGLNPERCGERPATNRLELSNHLTSWRLNFNIILPSTPGSSKWSPSLRFPHQNPASCLHLSSLPYVLHAPPIAFFVFKFIEVNSQTDAHNCHWGSVFEADSFPTFRNNRCSATVPLTWPRINDISICLCRIWTGVMTILLLSRENFETHGIYWCASLQRGHRRWRSWMIVSADGFI
jgi:hypothetical protein